MLMNRGYSPYGLYGIGNVARHGINWSSLLTNTQKTLGIINQAIPAFYQVKPVFNNLRTMFRVVNEINRDDKKIESHDTPVKKANTSTNESHSSVNQQHYYSDNSNNDDGPNFFL